MTPREQAQWLQLRALRVQRARDRVAAAGLACEQARQAVHERQRLIEHWRDALDRLGRASVTDWAPRLPRWGTMMARHRDTLADRLERDEYALIDDERALEQAQERLQACRAEQSRALARESAVQAYLQRLGRQQLQRREQAAELELDERGLAPAGGPAQAGGPPP